MEKLKVLVFGAGAIGTYIGGSLVSAGHEVIFLERPGVAEEIQRRGLHLEFVDSQHSPITIPASSFTVVESISEALRQDSFDFAIFALKSFDTSAALEEMQPYATQMPPILCLSNGVENEAALASVLGAEKVIPGTVTSSVSRGAVGEITLEKLRGVGVGDGHNDTEFLKTVDIPIIVRSRFAVALKRAVPNAQVTDAPGPHGWNDAVLPLLARGNVRGGRRGAAFDSSR